MFPFMYEVPERPAPAAHTYEDRGDRLRQAASTRNSIGRRLMLKHLPPSQIHTTLPKQKRHTNSQRAASSTFTP